MLITFGGLTRLKPIVDTKAYTYVRKHFPLACVDVLVFKHNKILLGKRRIPPYKDKWCTPGGIIRLDEFPKDTARRVVLEIGIQIEDIQFLGVFPVRFLRYGRYDISLCYTANYSLGSRKLNDRELSPLRWFEVTHIPENTGFNMIRMIGRKAS